MKITTINFWSGVFLGASFTILIPEWYKKYKKKLEVKNDNQKSYVNSGGVSNKDGSESDNSGLSKSQMQQIYDKLASMYQTDNEKEDRVVKETPYIPYLDNNIDPNFAVECPIPDNTAIPTKVIVSNGTEDVTIGKNYISSGGIKISQPDDSKVLINGVPIDVIDQSILYGNYPTCVDPNTNKISFKTEVTDTAD